MNAEQQAVVALENYDAARLEFLIQRWTKFFSETNWPFSYTDDIAKRCESLWTWIESSGARAELVTALVVLANRHNRFFVWRVAARLIEASQTRESIEQLVPRMMMLDEDELASVSDYLAKPKIASKLRPIFEMVIGASVDIT